MLQDYVHSCACKNDTHRFVFPIVSCRVKRPCREPQVNRLALAVPGQLPLPFVLIALCLAVSSCWCSRGRMSLPVAKPKRGLSDQVDSFPVLQAAAVLAQAQNAGYVPGEWPAVKAFTQPAAVGHTTEQPHNRLQVSQLYARTIMQQSSCRRRLLHHFQCFLCHQTQSRLLLTEQATVSFSTQAKRLACTAAGHSTTVRSHRTAEQQLSCVCQARPDGQRQHCFGQLAQLSQPS